MKFITEVCDKADNRLNSDSTCELVPVFNQFEQCWS